MNMLFSAVMTCLAIVAVSNPLLATEYTVRPGKSLKTPEGVFIQLIKVKEDSRCPTEVLCVWAGQFSIEGYFILPHPEGRKRKPALRTLTFPPFLDKNTSRMSNALESSTLKLELIKVLPVRKTTEKIPTNQYTLVFQVTELNKKSTKTGENDK